jgi:hypothetical protein
MTENRGLVNIPTAINCVVLCLATGIGHGHHDLCIYMQGASHALACYNLTLDSVQQP